MSDVYGSATSPIPTDEHLYHGGVARWVAIRYGKYKYIRTLVAGEMEEIYDVDADPEELTNLALKPENRALLADLRAQMRRRAAPDQRAVCGCAAADEADAAIDRLGTAATAHLFQRRGTEAQRRREEYRTDLTASCDSVSLRLCVNEECGHATNHVDSSHSPSSHAHASAELPKPTLPSPFVAVDLNIGESQEVTLADGKKVTVKLVDLKEQRDSLRSAVRRAEVKVEVGGADGDAGLGDLPPAGDRRRRADRLPDHRRLCRRARG